MLIDSFSKASRLETALELHKQMMEVSSSLNMASKGMYASLIRALCLASQVQEAFELYSEITRRCLVPELSVFVCLIKGLIELNKWNEALQLCYGICHIVMRIEPRYQEIQSKDIASTSADGVTVRVIAGHSMGVRSPVCTRTPTMYLDFTVRPHAAVRQPVCASWNAFAYVLEGEGVFGAEKSAPAGPHHLLLLGLGDGVEVWNKLDKPLRFLLIGGEPIGEPVAQLGPFVMNTEEEIDMTINDFEYYINGFEKAKHWKSQALVALGVE